MVLARQAILTDFAATLIKKMVNEGCKADSYTYSVLLQALCKQKKLNEALSILDQMTLRGVKCNIVSYTIIIGEMIKEGKHRVCSMK